MSHSGPTDADAAMRWPSGVQARFMLIEFEMMGGSRTVHVAPCMHMQCMHMQLAVDGGMGGGEGSRTIHVAPCMSAAAGHVYAVSTRAGVVAGASHAGNAIVLSRSRFYEMPWDQLRLGALGAREQRKGGWPHAVAFPLSLMRAVLTPGR